MWKSDANFPKQSEVFFTLFLIQGKIMGHGIKQITLIEEKSVVNMTFSKSYFFAGYASCLY